MEEEILHTRLNVLGPPLPVDFSTLTHNQVPAGRMDISVLYGGKSGQLFPKMSDPKFNNHGFDNWMIPNVQYHPFLPPLPGWPGLILRSKGVSDWKPEAGGGFRVVAKREPNFFEYVGQYEMVNLGTVSAEEWKIQPRKVLGIFCLDRARTELSVQGEGKVASGRGGRSAVESGCCPRLLEEAFREKAFRRRGRELHRGANHPPTGGVGNGS